VAVGRVVISLGGSERNISTAESIHPSPSACLAGKYIDSKRYVLLILTGLRFAFFGLAIKFRMAPPVLRAPGDARRYAGIWEGGLVPATT